MPKLQFATSGIRGKANTTISPELGLRVGRAVAKWVRDSASSKLFVYIGYDNRRNSHTIASTIVAGLSSSGVDAKLFSEPVPTPLVIYSTANTEAKAGIMVTGSHLPRDENGIILFDQSGYYYKGVLEESNEKPVDWKKLGKIENIRYEIDEYRSFLAKLRKQLGIRPFDWDILVDPVHGPMKTHLEYLLKPIVRNLIRFNWQDDDTFSGRLSEPTPSNLEQTKKAVTVSNCDLGIATDMDGDRVIFITKKSEVISGDYIGALLAMKYWNEFPDIPVVVPINTSAIINYMAEKVNGKVEYCKVGPPSIIEAMKSHQAKYGFEETGKYFFADFTIWPDASVSVLLLLSYLQDTGKRLHEMIAEMPKLYASKTKVPSSRDQSDMVMQHIALSIKEKFDNIDHINDMDGLRINFLDRSWLLIRPSGTEDYIRVFSEHDNQEANNKLNKTGRDIVEQALQELNLAVT